MIDILRRLGYNSSKLRQISHPAGGDAKYDAVSVFIATWCIALPLALIGTFVMNFGLKRKEKARYEF